jgi:hypothetical protein
MHSPERGDEKIEIVNFWHLVHQSLQVGHKFCRVKVVQDVEVQAVLSARYQSITIGAPAVSVSAPSLHRVTHLMTSLRTTARTRGLG